MKFLYIGAVTCIILVVGVAAYMFGFNSARSLAASFTATNIRVLGDALLQAEDKSVQKNISDVLVGNIYYLMNSNIDLDQIEKSNAVSLCVAAKHRVEILQKIVQNDATKKMLNNYLEMAENKLEGRVSFDSSLGHIDPCLQPL